MRTFLFICVFLSGCAVALTHQERMVANGKVAVLDQWIVNIVENGHNGHFKSPFRGVVLEVGNPRLIDINIFIVCEDDMDGGLFGISNDTIIPAGTKYKVMVRGLVRDGGQKLKCVLHFK